MMREFLDLVKYEQINNSNETLVQLLNDQYFGSAVKVKAVNTLKATIIPTNALENYDVQPVDTESIWISNHLSKRLSLNEGTEYGELKFSDIDEISLKVGDFLVPLTGIDQHVKENDRQSFFWDMLNDIYVYRKKSVSIYRERCGDFKKALKTSDFALLMSRLKYNLYIRKEGQTVPDAYRQFFEEVHNIEEFIDKNNQILFTGTHLEDISNYNFYIESKIGG